MESLAGKQIHFCFNNKFPLTAALPLIFFTVSQIDRIAKGRRRPTVLRATAANYLKQRIYGQLAKKLLNQFFECCLNGRWLHSSNWFCMHTHPVEKLGAARNVWHFCCQCACTLAFFAIFRSPSHSSMHEFSRNLMRLYPIKHTTWLLLSVFHTNTCCIFQSRGKRYCKIKMEKRSRKGYGSWDIA